MIYSQESIIHISFIQTQFNSFLWIKMCGCDYTSDDISAVFSWSVRDWRSDFDTPTPVRLTSCWRRRLERLAVFGNVLDCFIFFLSIPYDDELFAVSCSLPQMYLYGPRNSAVATLSIPLYLAVKRFPLSIRSTVHRPLPSS